MPAKFVRSVSRPSELTGLIDEKIDSDHCRSAHEVIHTLCRLAERGQQENGSQQKWATGGRDAR